jgi:hypothetical protein
MYKPNFCAECGSAINRAKWRPWTSRRFCENCRTRFRKAELWAPLVLAFVLLMAGFTFGRFLRPAPPPLMIQRSILSPLSDAPWTTAAAAQPQSQKGALPGSAIEVNNQPVTAEELIYTCGARTKKGTPCARRVHGPVRCWQHKGSPAMLPQEKLLVKD